MARRRSEELSEIGRLFRAKLRQLREQEARSSSRARKLSAASRRRSKLEAIDSPPGDGDLLSSSELARG